MTVGGGVDDSTDAAAASWIARELIVAFLLSLLLTLVVEGLLLAFGSLAPLPGAWGVSMIAVLALRIHRFVLPDRRLYKSAIRAARQAAATEALAVTRALTGEAPSAAAPVVWVESLPTTLERRFTRMYRHTDRISYAVVAARHYDAGVRPVLADLAADRLRRFHGVDLEADPERGRAILGEDLWQAMTGSSTARGSGSGGGNGSGTPPPTVADLDRWTTALERLDPRRRAS